MAARNILIYLRLSGRNSVPVKSNNKPLSKNELPVIFHREKPVQKIRPLHFDGTPYTLSDFSGYGAFEFGIDNDFNENTTAPVYKAGDNTVFSVSEVTDNEITYVEITCDLSGNTSEFTSKMEEGTVVEATGELNAYDNSTDETPSLIVQFPYILAGKVLPLNGENIPDEIIQEYYKAFQVEAAIDAKMSTHETNYDHSKIAQNESGVSANAGNISTLQATASDHATRILDLETWKQSGQVYRLTVLDLVDCTTAPPTTASGDRYILDNSGTPHEDWGDCLANQIVESDGTTWTGETPFEGTRCYVDEQDKDARYIDDGTGQWELVVASGVSSHLQLTDIGSMSHTELEALLASHGIRITDLENAPDPSSEDWTITTTASVTVESGKGYFIDRSVTTTLVLPTSPSANFWFQFRDYKKDISAGETVALTLNNEKFEGEDTYELDICGASGKVVYSGSTMGYLITTEIGGSGALIQGENIGLSEIKTNNDFEESSGNWKPIYRKKFDIGSLPNASTNYIAHGISDLSKLVNSNCVADNGSNRLPLGYVYVGGSKLGYYLDSTNIYIVTATDRTAYSGFITLEYTKTTDTATSSPRYQ